ncbi:MAG: hypothetical protein ABSC55_13385 [Syntrophorhabdales bacterium]|jgi:hypothetical protein
MDKRKMKIAALGFISVLFVGSCLLGSVHQATAETLTFKTFTHVTKADMVPVGDVDGHVLSLTVREGVILFQNGESTWMKAMEISDLTKGAGPSNGYITVTFLDGSTFTAGGKSTWEATPQGTMSGAKITRDIIHGTGRFQGIKGTYTASSKMLPPEKGETMAKGMSEGTIVYTLPSK